MKVQWKFFYTFRMQRNIVENKMKFVFNRSTIDGRDTLSSFIFFSEVGVANDRNISFRHSCLSR